MSKLSIVRMEKTSEHTLGAILVDGVYTCMCLERPWLGNERDVSCIPSGLYEVRYHTSHKFGWTLKVMDVPSRSNIMFHSGNTARDTEGCILPGQGVSYFGVDRAVTGSRNACTLLLSLLPEAESHLLEVIGR